MLKKLGISTLALAATLAVAAPTASFARDRDDHRGDRREVIEHRDHDGDRFVRDRGHDGFRFGVGFNAAPAAGYYDQFGVWHPYGFYDRFGVWRAY
jgi:hypothetical protein